jgi:hypothetical protein
MSLSVCLSVCLSVSVVSKLCSNYRTGEFVKLNSSVMKISAHVIDGCTLIPRKRTLYKFCIRVCRYEHHANENIFIFLILLSSTVPPLRSVANL